MSMEEMYLTETERKKFQVTVSNFLSQDDLSCHWTKFPVTGRNFLSQEDICNGNVISGYIYYHLNL